MIEKIFSGFGIEIWRRGERYFVKYDAGEIAVQFREDEITEAEAAKAQECEQSAYEVLLACQQRRNS